MNLDDAIKAHGEWKIKLRMAMVKKERLDAATIARDDCCALGKWLHGDAKSRYGSLPAYRDCVTKHAAFHRQAGGVAQAINNGDYAGAERMLEGSTPYWAASNAVGSAILGLKKAAVAPA